MNDPSHSVEEELLAERELLRVTLASIDDAVVSTDADGRVVCLNRVAERLTGWTQAEATGRPLDGLLRIIDETTRAPVENPALRALREGRIVELANHNLLVSGDGGERPIEDSAAPMLDPGGRPLGAVLVLRDVSERKHAEEARARLAAIVESSDDAIVSKNLQGIILSWNAGAERLFGYTAAEAVGQHITLLIPPNRSSEEADIMARLEQGLRVEPFETVRVAKGGRLIDISLSVSPVKDHEGRVIGAAKIARDITARKRADEALRVSERGRHEAAERLALAATAASLGDWSWDATTDTAVFSSRAAAIFGLPPGSRLTQTELQALIHEEDRERARVAVARAIAGHRQYEVEYRLTRPSGEEIWISSKGRAQYHADGSTSGLFGVVQDIT